MDYCQLLYKAQENKNNASHKEVRCYSTSFGAPKKLERSKVSSENIKKFLARKEEEEKKKFLEAKKKKDELLALRSQDKKAQKRVQVMLKRTKSANKSVMADAIDNVNTADTLAGPRQCDEDDYGYVSQEASAYYAKLMDKYQNMPPEKSLFAKGRSEVKDLNAAKDRVKAALLKEAEDELAPHKRKRKKKDGEEGGSEPCSSTITKEEDTKEELPKQIEKPKKPKRLMPPPVDFVQLLKIAEKKQFEPIIIEKVEAVKEPERLMTKKEKLEYMKEKERRAQKELGKTQNENKKQTSNDAVKDNQPSKKPNIDAKKKETPENLTSTPSNNNIPIKSKSKSSANESMIGKIPLKPERIKEKGNSESVEERLQKSSQVWSKPCNMSNRGDISAVKRIPKNIPEQDRNVHKTSSNSSGGNISEKKIKQPTRETQEKKCSSKKPETPSIPAATDSHDELSDIDREIELLRKKRELLANRNIKTQAQEVKEVVKPPVINNPTKPKASPQKPIPTESKPVRIAKPRVPDLKRMKRKRRRLDSDSEYDSELEDFIDDAPDEDTDYSKHIREIFGYDKSRYRDYDDGECMESNFAQQMKEEYVSTKIGILEDLEDIRKEQEEKARKKMKKV